MTRDLIINKLPTKVDSGGETVVLICENMTIEIVHFINMFKGAELNFLSLSTHESCTSGWRDVFNEWEQQGILN